MKQLAILLASAVLLLTVSTSALAANALIVHDGSAVSPGPDIRTTLQNRLIAKGYTVTQNVGVPAGSLATYQQIWDLRYSTNGAPPGNAFTPAEITQYLAYLNGGGSLFLMGENGISFATRNQAIADFITAAGGGTVTLSATTGNTQTVQAPFTGPTAITTVAYSSVGGVTSLPKGQFVTKDTATSGAAIALGPGTMTNAATGTLIAVFDVNFLQSTANENLQALSNNIISYLAAPAAPPPATADLSVTKTQSLAGPLPGQNLTYTLVVTNNGTGDASAVTLSDTLPANTTFVSGTAPSGWTTTTPAVGATGVCTATRATLANGSGAQTFTITVMVNPTALAGAAVTNTATVSSTTTDPAPANNSSTVTATVAAPVPTMGEWAMIVTTLLLAAAGVLALKRRPAGVTRA